MDEAPADRCGYTWPEGYDVGDEPNHQSCCFREVLSDTNRCAWHADPDDTDEKTIQTLRDVRVNAEVREKTNIFNEYLDGAVLCSLELGDELSLSRVTLRDADLTDADLTDADLTDSDLTNASLLSTDLTDANLLSADLIDAYLLSADLTDADLRRADLPDAYLRRADLTDADLRRADLTNANLTDADLTNANLTDADLTDANLTDADLTDAHGSEVNITNANLTNADLTDVGLYVADLTDADLCRADLTDADFYRADLTDVDLCRADLTDADLRKAKLSDVKLERATLIRTDLFGATLTGVLPHGATMTDVQINADTTICSEGVRSDVATGLQKLSPPPFCGYDIERRQNDDLDADEQQELLAKAADAYQEFEELARENAQPALQSSMFVLRQDMQRARYWQQEEYLQHAFARVSRSVFKHGESLFRIFLMGFLIILGYAAVYAQFDLVLDLDGGGFIQSPVDAIYFSTLTFTTLGLGDFQPDPASEIARALVTTQAALGAILIAIFVFVLGRRAAR